MSQKVATNAYSGTWGAPILISGEESLLLRYLLMTSEICGLVEVMVRIL